MLKRFGRMMLVCIFVFVSVLGTMSIGVKPAYANDTIGTQYKFDFGTSSSPVQSGYTKIVNTSMYIYGGGSSYGFINATSSQLTGVDRGTPTSDSYKRDFIMRQDGNPLRFRVNGVSGKKRVTVTIGDATQAQGSFNLAAEYNGDYAYLVKNETIPAGEFRTYSIDLAYTGIPINIDVTPTGSNTTVRLNSIVVEIIAPGDDIRQFDMGNGDIAAGYLKANKDIGYSSLLGYGWTDTTNLTDVDRGAPDALKEDYVKSTSGSFEFKQNVVTKKEFFKITITAGDNSAATSADDIYVEGFRAAKTSDMSAGQFNTIVVYTACNDGIINIQFGQNIYVNAIVVEPSDYAPWQYDFGTASSPVEAGYIGVSASDTYSELDGYGIVGTVGERNRSTSDDLKTDFVMASDWTFKQDLVSQYPYWTVTITIGDASGTQQNMEIYAEGNLLRTVYVGAGTYTVVTENVTCTDGVLDLRFRGQNGSDWARVNAIVIEPNKAPYTYKYDMGTSTSPVETGYTRVTNTDAYNGTTGYGWTSTSYAQTKDNAIGDNLTRDHVYYQITSGSTEFKQDLPSTIKDWKVTVNVGEQTRLIGEDVVVEGNSMGKISTTVSKKVKTVKSAVKVYDGQMNIVFKPNPDWPRINSIVIEPLISEAPWKLVKLDTTYGNGYVKFEDVNNDGEVEVISGRSNQYTTRDAAYASVCVQKMDGTVLWTYGNPADGTASAAGEGGMIIYDIDQDGQKEILCSFYGTTTSYFRVFNAANGTIEKQFVLPENTLTTFVQVANLTGDSYADDLIIKDNYYHIYAYNWNGGNMTLYWMQDFRDGAAGSINKWPDGSYKAGNGNTFTGHNPLIADIDNDGKHEIITGEWCLNPNGTERWHMTQDANTVIYGTRSSYTYTSGNGVWVGDHQDDSQMLVDGGTNAANYRFLLTFGDEGMFVVDGNGLIKWERHGGHWQWAMLGNLTSNSGNELIGFNGIIYSIATGQELVTSGLHSMRGIRDWNNDGYDEMVSPQSMDIFKGNGVTISRLHNPLAGGTWGVTPFKAQMMSKYIGQQKALDLDLDGRSEYVMTVGDENGDGWVMFFKNELGAVVSGTHRGAGIDTYGY